MINLKGFQPTWVSRETGHWHPLMGETARAYVCDDLRKQELVAALTGNPPGHCLVFSASSRLPFTAAQLEMTHQEPGQPHPASWLWFLLTP